MAIIGQSLTSPETGWKRYDQTDSKILYSNGSWNINNITTSAYGGSWASSNSLDATITFKFYGDKLRLIGSLTSSWSNNIDIYIDNIFDNTISEYNSNESHQILIYEKINLPKAMHEIKIINKTSNYLILDAIDIDLDSILYGYNESINRFLIQQGNDIYSIKQSDFNKIGITPVTQQQFNDYGGDNKSIINISQSLNTSHGIDKGSLGNGKYFSIPIPIDFKSINIIK